MNRKRAYQLLTNGEKLTSDDLTALGMPAIPAAIADYVAAKLVPGAVSKITLTLTSLPIALADEATVVAYGSSKLLDFPAGVIAIQGAFANLTVTKSSAGVNNDFDGDFAIGTVAASNNATLASTEQDIIPTTATPQAVAGATTAKGKNTATEQAVLDGTATAVDVYLNFLVDDADHNVAGTACNLVVSGTIVLLFSNLGDY